MPGNATHLSQFWQELKRRNVVRVITVYAGAAFAILELVDIIADPLKLPAWLLPVVIVLLSIGFVIAVILSWIYDIHPEKGMVKTDSDNQLQDRDIPKSRNNWKIASYISFLVIVGLIVLNVIPQKNRERIRKDVEKSIAILPFSNDSPDQENEYFINGMMESILNNLAKISDLRVISRSSVEQFRDSSVFIPDVAKFLNVSYILEGSMQKYGNRIRMTLQLIDQNDRHVWSEQYDREIKTVEENLSLQSEIAKLVANELQAAITPVEMEFLNKMPTTSLKAYDFYQRGRESYWRYWSDHARKESLERSTEYLMKALDYDSTFAEAYTGLARNYFEKNFWEEYFSGDFMDSALSLVNTSLYYENQQADAYLIRGRIFIEKDLLRSASHDLKLAVKLNPNSWENYFRIGNLSFMSDNLNGIYNLFKAASLNYGSERPIILKSLASKLAMAGFDQLSELYFTQALELDDNLVDYYTMLAANENWRGNYSASIEDCQKALHIDPSYAEALERMAYNYMLMGEYDQSYRYYSEMEKSRSGSVEIDINDRHRIGYVYWKAGLKDQANSLFDLQEQYCLDMIELGRGPAKSGFAYYDLAGVYAFRGQKELALENLRIFNHKDNVGIWLVTLINDDPLFDTIRDDPEFRQIVRDVEARYQAEHERVRQWLEKNDML
jgi:TolB-like protein/Tfp pilus assembly protein PilF